MDSKKNVNAGDGILDFKKIMDTYPDVEYIYEQEQFDGERIDCVDASIKFMLS